MRITVDLDEDVTAAVKEIGRLEGLSVGDALNRLIRDGLGEPPKHGVEPSETDIRTEADDSTDTDAHDRADRSPLDTSTDEEPL